MIGTGADVTRLNDERAALFPLYEMIARDALAANQIQDNDRFEMLVDLVAALERCYPEAMESLRNDALETSSSTAH